MMRRFLIGLGCAATLACGGESGESWEGLGRRVGMLSEVAELVCGDLEANCSDRCTGSFENVECTGVLSGNFDNVIVPPGADCTLSGALLTGNLIVEENASATIGDGVFVCGDLQSDEARSVATSETQICGNLQIDQSESAAIGASTDVLKNGEFKKSNDISVVDTLICADAQFAENESVELPAGAPSVVIQNCSSDENTSVDFTGIDVRGDDDGCAGTR